MYLLLLDESGTHGGSPVFILGGLAVHEDDARHLQVKIESFLQRRLAQYSLDSSKFELHATELRNRRKEWAAVPSMAARMSIMRGAYSTLSNYVVQWPTFPLTYFGAVIDKAKIPDRKKREEHAYELVLNKFDDMLGRINRDHDARQRGLVIHDQRVVAGGGRAWTDERVIQEWTRDWREVAGRLGRLREFADVPLFADSKATRLIQAADLIAFALWRHYGANDPSALIPLLPRFDHVDQVMHGLIHVSRDYAVKTCPCPPCRNRLDRGLPTTP